MNSENPVQKIKAILPEYKKAVTQMDYLRFIRYLSFKMDCLREQEVNPLTLDVELCEKYLSELGLKHSVSLNCRRTLLGL